MNKKFKFYRGRAKCDSCGHEWITKKLRFDVGPSNWSEPSNCPKCHSRKLKWESVWGLLS